MQLHDLYFQTSQECRKTLQISCKSSAWMTLNDCILPVASKCLRGTYLDSKNGALGATLMIAIRSTPWILSLSVLNLGIKSFESASDLSQNKSRTCHPVKRSTGFQQWMSPGPLFDDGFNQLHHILRLCVGWERKITSKAEVPRPHHAWPWNHFSCIRSPRCAGKWPSYTREF